MKERIYSIPLTEALEENSGCPLCTLEKKLQEQAVEYFLGPSMMEPDSREMTNEKGFCKNHIKMLFDRNNRLSLALMLETHIKELEKSMEIPKKSGMFSKEAPADIFSSNLYRKATSCALCEKLDSQMSDAAENFAHLWANEADFRKMFENSKGLCLEHTALAAQKSSGEIHGKKKEEFLLMLAENQKKQLGALYENLHNFTLSFDYRNAGKELSTEEKESVKTAISYLSKNI